MCFDAKTTSPMHKSAYKDILGFLNQASGGKAQGHFLKRLQVITGMVCSCMTNKQCTVEALSDGLTDSDKGSIVNKESQVKQVKRTLSNKWIDWELFYMPFAIRILKSVTRYSKRLVFAIDGSQTGSNHTTLMVSLIFRGFAIPIVWIVKEGEKGHFPEDMHIEVMELLRACLPLESKVVLLGDGEFDGARLRKLCCDAQWEFVVRTSSDRQIDCDGEIARFDRLAPSEKERYVFVPDALKDAHGVLWHEKGFEKPLYLLTNIPLAKEACFYYKLRFKIETMFKLLKSRGVFLHKTQLQTAHSISNLLIVVSIAFCFNFCLGCVLKEDTPIARLKRFVRQSKIKTMTYICIAQHCLKKDTLLALEFFSNISKNFYWAFS